MTEPESLEQIAARLGVRVNTQAVWDERQRQLQAHDKSVVDELLAGNLPGVAPEVAQMWQDRLDQAAADARWAEYDQRQEGQG